MIVKRPEPTKIIDPSLYLFAVYAGSENIDLGPKGDPQALCQTKTQAEALIKALWPGFGYYTTLESKR